MNIAISQREHSINNFTYDCLSRDWFLFLSHHNITAIPNTCDFDITAYDMLILSGGSDTLARHETELLCYNTAIANNIPILGICHGAFFINNQHNGTVHTINGHSNALHTIRMEDTVYTVNSYHSTGILTLGETLSPIATCYNDVEAFKHNIYPVWGLVWHPERMTNPILPTELREILF